MNLPEEPEWVMNFFSAASTTTRTSGMYISNRDLRQTKDEETLSLQISIDDIILASWKFKEFLALTPGESGDPDSFGARYRMYATISEDTEEANELCMVAGEGNVRVWDVAAITKPGDNPNDPDLYYVPVLEGDNIIKKQIEMSASVSSQRINLSITILIYPRTLSPYGTSTLYLNYSNEGCKNLRMKKRLTRVVWENLKTAGHPSHDAACLHLEICCHETGESPDFKMEENMKLQILGLLIEYSMNNARKTMEADAILRALNQPLNLPYKHPIKNFLRNNRHKMKSGKGMIPVPFLPTCAVNAIPDEVMNCFFQWFRAFILKNKTYLEVYKGRGGTYADFEDDEEKSGKEVKRSLKDITVINLTPCLAIEALRELTQAVLQGMKKLDAFKKPAAQNVLDFYEPAEATAAYHYSFKKSRGSIPINRIDFHSKICKAVINLDRRKAPIQFIRAGVISEVTTNLSDTSAAYADIRARIRFLGGEVGEGGNALVIHY